MRVRATHKGFTVPRLNTLEGGAVFRLKVLGPIMMKLKDKPEIRDSKCPYVELYTGECFRTLSNEVVYPCDGEFMEAGAEGSNIQVKNCTVHNIHNESGDAFRKSNPQGIRRESGTTPGGGKYDMVSVDDAPAFKKRLDELVKAKPGTKSALKAVGIIIDETEVFKAAYETLAGEDENAGSYIPESGKALENAINKTWDEAKEADKEAAKIMAKEHIDKKVRFTGTMEEFRKYIETEDEGSVDDPASECLKKIRAELKTLKEKNLSPEEEKAESFRIISQFDDSIAPDFDLHNKPTGNPHWCQFCGRIHHPEPGIIPGDPKKAGKPIKCPAGVPWDNTPYTGIHSSSCPFWVPSNLHAGDYRCPECHAVMIEMAPNELDTNPLCPTCDVAAGFIDMSKIHDESAPFEPPEPYIEEEVKEESQEAKSMRALSINLEALLSTLIPCPECKSIKVLELQSGPEIDGYRVFCQMCAFVGPSGETESEAVNLWNEIDRQE